MYFAYSALHIDQYLSDYFNKENPNGFREQPVWFAVAILAKLSKVLFIRAGKTTPCTVTMQGGWSANINTPHNWFTLCSSQRNGDAGGLFLRLRINQEDFASTFSLWFMRTNTRHCSRQISLCCGGMERKIRNNSAS